MAYCRLLALSQLVFFTVAEAQLPVARDFPMVKAHGALMRMPWAGGLNSANVSNIDLNLDGKQDLVFFDQQDIYRNGIFRCYLNDGLPGELKYRSDPGLSYFFPQLFAWAVLRDYNNDGKADIFTSTTGGIKVYRNTTVPGGLPEFVLENELLKSNYYPASQKVKSNLYAGSSGPPGISDVDGDGDLDVLTFSPLGIYLELHTNMSRELFGHSDSLVFQRNDACWGDLAESSCSVDFEICSARHSAPSKELHAGACIACLDNDGDNDMDLIMGDVSCDFVHYVHNGGSAAAADFNDTTRLYPNFPQKNDGSTAIRMNFFPCAYPVDADNNGQTDLIATPNVTGGENASSVWLYRNTGAGNSADFKLHQKDFMQSEMIDAGQNSYPALMDVDADGKKDLLIGTRGFFVNGKLVSRLILYRNTGSNSVPSFSLVNEDFANISTYSLNTVIPATGDIDGDGDNDICIGTSAGQIHWLENTAGPGKVFSASFLKINPFNIVTQSAMAAPQIFDFDNDGKRDLMVGMKNGRISWYRGTGSQGSPTFSLMTNTLGNIDVKADPAYFGNDGYAVPYFFIEAGKTFALVGSVTGRTHLYEVSSAAAPAMLVSSAVNALFEGSMSAPCYDDINADGKRDLFLGNASGGLSFFSSASPFVDVNHNHRAQGIICYPNPVSSQLIVEAPANVQTIILFDITGRMVYRGEFSGLTTVTVNLGRLQNGIYFVQTILEDGKQVGPFVSRIVKE